MKLCLGLLVVASFASFATVGCSVSTDESTGEAADDDKTLATEDELTTEATANANGASCTYPRRYAAILLNEACTTVSMKRGKWIATPAFPGAPRGACTYDWQGEYRARVDRDGLKSFVHTRGILTEMCGEEDGGLNPAHVQEIPQLSIYGLAGSVGCDVCGIVRNDGRIWIVIPPDLSTHREFQIPLTNGSMRSFSIQSAPNASVMSMTLPPAPVGVQYVGGPVHIY